jgi:hypothetical protein
MTTTITIILIAALIIASIFVTLRIRNIKRDNQIDADYRKAMEEGLRENRNQYVTLKANGGRITAHIIKYKFHTITVYKHVDGKRVPVNTFTSLSNLFSAEELDQTEVRELKDCDNLMVGLRRYLEDEVEVKPQGFTEHPLPKYGTFRQYMPGDLEVCGTNRVAVTIGKRADDSMFIDEVHISVNLLKHDPVSFKISDATEYAKFKEDFLNDKVEREEYLLEFDKIQDIQKEITEFNNIRHMFKFDDSGNHVVSFRPGASKSQPATGDRFKNIPSAQ